MIPKEESLNCLDLQNQYIIKPKPHLVEYKKMKTNYPKGKPIIDPFEYSSENNKKFFEY